ncbi:hypothetical protein [Streptomyces sp. NPDC056361]|uniref:hypothetical protein n=1 Tax=Streptomyces sp. NPDC056361 TaxID=3345795 RepID=UPI0035DD1631
MRSDENPVPIRTNGDRTPEHVRADEPDARLRGLLALQRSAGNAAVAGLLQGAGHPWAQTPVQRMWNGSPGSLDTDGDLHMGTQQSDYGSQSSQATVSSQASQQSASFPSLDLYNLAWTPHQLSRPRAERDVREAQAEAMARLHTLVIPAVCEGSPPSLPEGAAHPDADYGDVDTITVYRDAGWRPPNTATRGGSLQTSFIANYHSAYFNYRVELANDAASETHINPGMVFRVLTQTPRSNGRGSQGRTYLFEHRWAPNPGYAWAPGQDVADIAELFGLDPDEQLGPQEHEFVALPSDDTHPFVFLVEEDRPDDRFLDDDRRFMTGAAFDHAYLMAGLTGSAREQVRHSEPPLHDRRTAGRSTSQAMANTQAHEWMDARGSMGGKPGVLAKYEWCHLIGDGDSGPNIPQNLVIGTNAVNTEQLAMEIGLRRYVRQLRTEGYAIELRVRATMENAPEQSNPAAPPILAGAPLMADWISYEITIVSPLGRDLVHRQIMDAKRGTITESEFAFLQNTVERRIRAFIETQLGAEAESDDEDVVGADVEL